MGNLIGAEKLQSMYCFPTSIALCSLELHTRRTMKKTLAMNYVSRNSGKF